MFLAIIIPPARTERFIGLLVLVSMAASFAFSVAPLLKSISSGFRIIILTVVLAGAAAWLHPVEDGQELACTCRFRYRQPDQDVVIVPDGSHVHIRSIEPQRAVTPGQSAVFYLGDECLGGCIVTEVLEAGNFE